MALYIDKDECIACGDCEPVCPTGAIKVGAVYKINPKVCTECEDHADEPQCVAVCEQNCIHPLAA